MRREILDTTAPVVFFPVRHHSPAAARAVRRLVTVMRPAAVLVEGPADFDDRIDELALPHRLPIAIYSYVRAADGSRRAAYYPFCVYSPEWQALAAAREVGAVARFIDLPWAESGGEDEEPTAHANGYADGELRAGGYVAALCRAAGVEDFDAFWDLLVEIDPDLDVATYLERCHAFCYHSRVADRVVPARDLRREAFMAAEIARARAEIEGRILVVTGGFHSYALWARAYGVEFDHGGDPNPPAPPAVAVAERGISLTPYSYERLDNLAGYEAGMPNPGFYHRMWEEREGTARGGRLAMLALVAEELRRRGQAASTADLVAVEATAGALAALRGHREVWRRDLVDGVVGALLKDEIDGDVEHQFLAAVRAVFRGGERGRLADGTRLPPLVDDIRRTLEALDLEPAPAARRLELDFARADDLARSRALHRLRVVGVAGFAREAGVDWARREDTSRAWERWRLAWTPEHDGTAIEAAVYGPTLAEAATSRLVERASRAERDAEAAAIALVDAALCGLDRVSRGLAAEAIRLVRAEGDFASLARALGHMLYLYRYDEALGTAGRPDLGALVAETYERGLWLLETLGPGAPGPAAAGGVAALLRTFETSGAALGLDRGALVASLGRVAADAGQGPATRGAAAGALFALGEATVDDLVGDVRALSDPSRLGDFLSGLFALAREAAQRHPALVASVDALLVGFDEEQFLEALPSLRLAFSVFTPREKHHMARTLLEAKGTDAPASLVPLAPLVVDAATAARVHAFEERLFRAVERYGIRGGGR